MKRNMLEVIGKEIDRIPDRYDLNLGELLELHDIYIKEPSTSFKAAYVYGFVMGSRAYKNGSYKEKRGKGEPFEVKADIEEATIEEMREKTEDPPKRPEKIEKPSYMICVGATREPEAVETWAYEDGKTSIYIETQDVGKVEGLIKKGTALLRKKIEIGAFNRCKNG